MNLLQGEEQPDICTNWVDEISAGEVSDVNLPQAPQNYLDKVKSYIRNNRDHLVIQKL